MNCRHALRDRPSGLVDEPSANAGLSILFATWGVDSRGEVRRLIIARIRRTGTET